MPPCARSFYDKSFLDDTRLQHLTDSTHAATVLNPYLVIDSMELTANSQNYLWSPAYSSKISHDVNFWSLRGPWPVDIYLTSSSHL